MHLRVYYPRAAEFTPHNMQVKARNTTLNVQAENKKSDQKPKEVKTLQAEVASEDNV